MTRPEKCFLAENNKEEENLYYTLRPHIGMEDGKNTQSQQSRLKISWEISQLMMLGVLQIASASAFQIRHDLIHDTIILASKKT